MAPEKIHADLSYYESADAGSETDDALYNTKFLIQNLHCTSCIQTIETVLNRLEPRPLSISHSIVAQFVSVNHYGSLSVLSLARALDAAGYEVYDVISNVPEDISFGQVAREDNESPGRLALPQSWNYWGFGIEASSKKRKRHAENCEQCRQEQLLGGRTRESGVKDTLPLEKPHCSDKITEELREEVEKSTGCAAVGHGHESHQTGVTMEVILEIDGMTCGSCVGNVAKALQDLQNVLTADVNLLAHTATVRYTGPIQAAEIIAAVEDIGYGATMIETKAIESDIHATGDSNDGLIKATISLKGMTCSTCTNSVHSVLKDLEFVASAEVNLVSNSATVILRGRNQLANLIEAVDDTGFEATIIDVVPLQFPAAASGMRRIQLDVRGMYCEHCPTKIREGIFHEFGNVVQIDDSFSLNKPIAVEYVPLPPKVTISSIVDSIESLDPAFSAMVYHPPSVEERSVQMHLKEQRRIFCRLLLNVCAAIPTFIIGIVYMNLVPSSNRGQQYLMTDLAGVSRATWAPFIMATPVYFFAADIFHRRALKEIWMLWRPGSHATLFRRFCRFGSMSMLISFGTTVAYVSSIVELAVIASSPDKGQPSSSQYFDSVIFLTMFLLLGRYIEAFSKSKTNDAVSSLGKLRPNRCLRGEVSESGGWYNFREWPADMLEIGDVIKVLRGGTPPADGKVVEGTTTFDESCLTGESRPVPKMSGDDVFSGTVNQGQAVCISVTGVAGNSMLDKIMDIVREGQTQRAPVERIADLLTAHFVPLVTLTAVLTWIIWLSLGFSGVLPESYRDTTTGGWTFWSLEFAIATFVIACPCGIGLAAPTALFVAGGLAAKHGILVKGGGEAFQEASNLDCVVFDKTGTLTVGGNPIVTEYEYMWNEPDTIGYRHHLLGAVKYLEQESSHPVAHALVAFVDSEDNIAIQPGNGIEEIPGKGMKGVFTFQEASDLAESRHTVLVGNEQFLDDYSVEVSKEASETLLSWKHQGKSVVCLAVGPEATYDSPSSSWTLQALFAIADPIRPEAHQVVRELQQRNIDIWMLTGDNSTTAYAVGKKLGISPANIIAGVMPEDKASKVKDLQQSIRGRVSQTLSNCLRRAVGLKPRVTNTKNPQRAFVAMVGDGINDAPALATADVGIAIGSGTDIALHTSKFILLQPSLTTLLTLLSLSRTVIRRIKLNFAWALIYNIIGIPIAAGVLYPIVSNGSHIRLDPAWAALAMAASSVSVVLSSLALRSRIPWLGFRISKVDLGGQSASDQIL